MKGSQMSIHQFFENYMQKQSFFTDKACLLSSYYPSEIKYREEQIHEIANILAPVLRLQKPSNLFVYGKTGTGKTLSIKHIISSVTDLAQKNALPLKSIYINCKLKRVADTEYRLLAHPLSSGRTASPYGKERWAG